VIPIAGDGAPASWAWGRHSCLPGIFGRQECLPHAYDEPRAHSPGDSQVSDNLLVTIHYVLALPRVVDHFGLIPDPIPPEWIPQG
jgi:hypothetical protein